MSGRLLITMLVAWGAFCCPFRCLHHQADSVAYFAVPDSSLAPEHLMPPSPPAEQNETGCICRGAYFVEAPTVVPIDLARWCPLVQESTAILLMAELELPGEPQGVVDIFWRPPLSGRTLRALHSSFLL